jgi:hypothetical protein
MEILIKFAWCAWVWLLQTLVVIGTITVILFVRVNFFGPIQINSVDLAVESDFISPLAMGSKKK